jgi:hypothetical protein
MRRSCVGDLLLRFRDHLAAVRFSHRASPCVAVSVTSLSWENTYAACKSALRSNPGVNVLRGETPADLDIDEVLQADLPRELIEIARCNGVHNSKRFGTPKAGSDALARRPKRLDEALAVIGTACTLADKLMPGGRLSFAVF